MKSNKLILLLSSFWAFSILALGVWWLYLINKLSKISNQAELPNPEITFGPGQFVVTLTFTSNEGCTDSVALPGLINVLDSIPEIPVIKRVSVLSNTSVLVDWEESVDPSFRSYNLFRKNIFIIIIVCNRGYSGSI